MNPPASEYNLYLIRHAIAEQRDETKFSDDAERPLTSKGKRKMEEISQGLVRMGVEMDWVVTSPLERAKQTAEIVAQELGYDGEITESETLAPGGSMNALLQMLAKRPEARSVALVGHEPDLSHLLAELVAASDSAGLGFRKGGVALVTFSKNPARGQGELVWLLTPKILRQLS